VLLAVLPGQQQQVAVGGLHVEDGDLGSGTGLLDDLEELALAVGLHVQGDDASGASAAGGAVGDLQACADAGKLAVEEACVHEGEDTASTGWVCSRPVACIPYSEHRPATAFLRRSAMGPSDDPLDAITEGC
jgi:hypothetical protein